VDETNRSNWLPGSWQGTRPDQAGQTPNSTGAAESASEQSADSAGAAAESAVLAPDRADAATSIPESDPAQTDTTVLSQPPSHDTRVLGAHDTSVPSETAPTAWPPPADAWPPPPAGPQPQGHQRGTSRRTVALVAGAGLIALVAGAAGGVVGYQLSSDGGSATAITAAPDGSSQASPPAEGSIAAIAAAVTPAVVNIETGTGSGSGSVISADGYVLTNNHVIAGADAITVNFADGTSADANLVGANPDYDLAVLKVDRTGLPVVALGSSDAVVVGDTAIAVGSPLGLSGTVTSGIISALDRPVTAGGQGDTSFINAIQTDAAINPGNSGGPLLNANGEVIGVNSAIATLGSGLGGQSGSIGLGFAIPIDTAKRIADEIIRTGSAETPGIGVSVEDTDQGATVAEVSPSGPADQAGVEAGDVITEVDGQPVGDTTELIVAIRDNAVGDTVTLTIQRDGREQQIDVTLSAL
jgi:putative serine protease PepD